MGLDTSHDCFHGPYSQFTRWRCWLAEQIGFPLMLMDGFCEFSISKIDRDVDETLKLLPWTTGGCAIRAVVNAARGVLPIKWEVLTNDPVYILINHSDCDGEIRWEDCAEIAKRLTEIADKFNGVDLEHKAPGVERGIYDGMVPATRRFATGLMRAYEEKKNVEFH